ncbi:acyl-CoA N-acyltransferase [Amanita muscaria]
MPATHTIPVTPPPTLYTVTRNGSDQHAYILDRHGDEVYVHYLNTDKRLDEWIPKANLRLAQADADTSNGVALETTTRLAGTKRKRGAYQLESSRARGGEELQEEATITISEEDYDLEQHKRLFAQRNFDKVHFGEWQIKTWYFSPYPLTEPELEDNAASTSSLSPSNSPAFASTSNTRGAAQKSAMNIAGARIPGVPRTTPRSHVRTSDLLAGGLGRQNMPPGERATLWVCDMCFKYMAEGLTWEMHKRECMVKHPPGRKVYQRGAHTIWEVDGAKDKLYCQNLSLFGKLFIDVKTLFFDSDNFLFYILTDATSQADHMMGFFSKEKVSFDSYNLACIITLPPYQRQGYGMLMIEFSYELSRRANQVGTPERPLSDLGLRSYLAYWVASLIRFFRRVLSALPHDAPKQAITTRGNFPDIVNGCRSPSSLSSSGQEDLETSSLNASAKKRRKSVKGWDGENGGNHNGTQSSQQTTVDDPQFTSLRTFTTTPQADGSAVTHVSVRCTLSDIAHATNLRIEDAAFALNECGLLIKKIKAKERNIDVVEATGIAGVSANDTVVLTREMVEQVAKERNVKKPCMDRAYVLL